MSHIATLISHPDSPQITNAVLSDLENHLNHPVQPIWLHKNIACDIDLTAQEAAKIRQLQPELDKHKIDIAVQIKANRKKSILIADMDSTMIEQECIDELAAVIGLKEKVADITARAMRGEIDFEPALRERVALLKGIDLALVDKVIKDQITLRTGGRTLVQTMKAQGGYTALVSGGFTLFTSRIAASLGFDENRANTLLTEANNLNGKVTEPVLGAEAKVTALKEICVSRGATPDNVMAIGDGANDLAMIQLAGSGVAVHAKPKVAASADMAINHGDLTALLFIQGYRQSEFVS